MKTLLLVMATLYFGVSSSKAQTACGCQSPLPLTFLSFNGYLIQGNAELEWKTANESNTLLFVVERSLDGINYTQAGIVPASGNTSDTRKYQFTDMNAGSLSSAVIYYRLLQKDIDGKFTYSKVIMLSGNLKSDLVVLYPNPVKNEVNLMFSIQENEKVMYSIVNNEGRKLKQYAESLPAGSKTTTVNVNDLPAGIYFVKFESKSFQQSIKFIKK